MTIGENKPQQRTLADLNSNAANVTNTMMSDVTNANCMAGGRERIVIRFFAQRNDEVLDLSPILLYRISACLASGGLACHMLMTRGNAMSRDQPSPKVREWLFAAKRGSLGRSCVSPNTRHGVAPVSQ